MDDHTNALVEMALIETKLAVDRTTRQQLCAQLASSADLPLQDVKVLRQRIADIERSIVDSRRRWSSLLTYVDPAPEPTSPMAA